MNIEELNKPLDRRNVKTRSKGKFDLSYIEGWWAISEANRIFGFDNWQRETVYCKEVCRYETSNNKHKVGYEAQVKITVLNPDGALYSVVREGTGHGSGIANDLYDAIEGAAKEAETDAMKRALMTFGNPFGLALYDKDQKNVAILPDPADMDKVGKAIEFFRELIDEDQIEENYKRAQTAFCHLNNLEGSAVMKGLTALKAGVTGKKKYANILNEYLNAKEADFDNPDTKRVDL